MRRGALPEGRAAEAPVWLPHAVIARGHRRSPDPSAPDFLRVIGGVHMSERLSPLVAPPPIGVSDKQIGDRKRKIRTKMECDTENGEPRCSRVVYLLKEVTVKPSAAR